MATKHAVLERPVQLGPDGHLVGVLTTPSSVDALSAQPIVLFLNAGVIHRVGPHRLHVNLARQLGACGIASFRLDISGIGDSTPVPGSPSFRQGAVVDVCAAMDWLAGETGSSRFILFGLCSGADNALATAIADRRVIGLVVVDPPTYVTTRSFARKLTARLRALRSARDLANETVRLARRLVPVNSTRLVGGREIPPADDYRATLTTLIGSGVAILAVFSGGLDERYNHPDQLFELFPELRGKVDRAYFPAANHTFTDIEAQAALLSTVTAWIERRR